MVSPASASANPSDFSQDRFGAIMRRVPSHHPDPALRRRPKGPGQRHPNALKSCKPKQNDRLQGIAPDRARRRHDQHLQREQQATERAGWVRSTAAWCRSTACANSTRPRAGTSGSRCESDPAGNLQTWKTKICLLIPFGPGRSDRACRSGRTWGTRRSGEAAVLYHHVPRIRSGRDLYDTSGRKLRSNPPKPSGRSALDFHGFAWTDPDLHAGLAGSSYSSDDDQLALRYGGGCYEYFRMRAFSPRNRKASYKSSNGAKRLCEHHRPPCFPHRFACVAHRRLRDQLGAKAPVLDIGYGSRLFELIELGKLVGDTKADDVP
jgi:hypothetical protein